MREYVALIGLDQPEANAIRDAVNGWCITRATLPRVKVEDGVLWVETETNPRYVPVSKLVYHAIFEDDLDFITGLTFWDGPCFPNPRAMMDLRLKLPGLRRALDHTRFAFARGYATGDTPVSTTAPSVAKWGNWHCGENKERFGEHWTGADTAIIEPFIDGEAVRVVIVGDHHWQIKLEGENWLKSIHSPDAAFMPVNDDLLADTRTIQAAFEMEIIANDYMIGVDGTPYLLEVNHIPNVTRFPEIWDAYRDTVVNWINAN